MKVEDLYWLAGILEGEGCFLLSISGRRYTPIISVHMTDEDIINRVSKLWDRKYVFQKRQKEHYKDTYITKLKGKDAIELMKLIYPIMGKRRCEKIDNIIIKHENRPIKIIRNKMSISEVYTARKMIKDGSSLRSTSKLFGVCHEALRQRFIRHNLWP